MNAKEVRKRLLELKDEGYRNFTSKLIPTVDPERIIGVRTPLLRKLSRELYGTDGGETFLCELPHFYLEENHLHAFLVERIGDFDECMRQTERFLPFVDNWATCDSFDPPVFGRHLPELCEKTEEWMKSDHPYTLRFGIEMLMKHFLDGAFSSEFPERVAAIRSEDYYVNMMIAWYFATALAKQYDRVLPFLQEERLDKRTHNKAVQKAVESLRITDEQKNYLRTLRRR
ncbi:MAG: DNA alkylation repair protein [Clostridia bacterium]|nr:DNA alkylation repair protein [Clostridia bacterium]